MRDIKDCAHIVGMTAVLFASGMIHAAGRMEAVNLYVSEKGDWHSDSGYAYKTIAEAVTAATVAGDVIWVKDGYVCSNELMSTSSYGAKTMIVISRAITLRSEAGFVDEAAGKGATIRGKGDVTPGSSSTRPLVLEKGTLVGFVIEDGASGSGAGTYGGGGIRLDGGVVSNCVVRNCHATGGGGIYGSGQIHCSVITNNAATGSGGGVNGNLSLKGCTVSFNSQAQNGSSSGGGGIFLTASGVAIDKCTISDNIARSAGGGVYAKDLSVEINSCTIARNRCGKGPDGVTGYNHWGAGVWGGLNSRTVVVRDTVFNANESCSSGDSAEGAAACGATVIGGSAVGNVASFGGAFGSCTVVGVEIRGNTAHRAGGGVSACIVTNCWIACNKAESTSASDGGGGAYNCDLTGCVISNNTAVSFGGGVYVPQAKTVERCQVVDNVLTGTSGNSSGGGIYAPVAIDIRNCLVARNESSSNTSAGGVIGSATAPCRLINCTVVENNGDRYGDRNSSVGGVRNVNIVNTIVWGNIGKLGDVSSVFSATNCCVKTDLSAFGPGNISDDPKLSSDLAHRYWLTARSPCRGTGYSESGEPVDMGAFPYMPLSGLMLLLR